LGDGVNVFAAGITVSAISGPTSESAGTATFTIVLDTPPSANVSIGLTSTDVSEGTASPTSLTFTPGNWSLTQTVIVTGADDNVDDGDVVYTIATDPATCADVDYDGVDGNDVAVTNTDNDTAGVSITQSGGSTAVSEAGQTSDSYTIVLDSEPTDDVTLLVDPDDQTDVGAGAGSAILLTFTPANWNAGQTVTATAVDDAVVEGAHASTVVHSGGSSDPLYDGIAIADVTVNVTDNDTVGVGFVETSGSTLVKEQGTTSDSYDVVLNSRPTADVSITVTPDGETDLGSGPGVAITLTFTTADWNAARQLTATAVDDLVSEGAHTSTITHTAASVDTDYDGITINDVLVSVTDNDAIGARITESGGSTDTSELGPTSDTYTVSLESPPTADVVVTVTPDGQTDVGGAPATPITVTFTPADWNVPQTVTVTAVDDFVAEGAHTPSIAHTASSADANYDGLAIPSLTVTITDNDVAGVNITELGGSTDVSEADATSDTYTVVLNSQPTANATVTAAPDDQTDLGAGAGAAVALTFTAGNWNVPQTVTVTAVDDAVVEGSHTSTTTHPAASTDTNYSGAAVNDVIANVSDDDAASVTIAESGGSTDVSETGPTSDTYTVVLTSQPAVDVIITVDPDNQTDLGSGVGTPITLTFTSGDWSVARTVFVTAVDDSSPESPHTSTITHSAASGDGDYDAIAINLVTAAIADDDVPGVSFVESAGSTSVNEAGPTSDSYTVVLDSQPTADAAITVDPDDQADLSSGVGTVITLTFTSGNWSTAQTVSVAAVDDAVAEGTHALTIIHTATSGDTDYDGISISDVTVTIADNETAGVTIA
jgi:hypothetical protein